MAFPYSSYSELGPFYDDLSNPQNTLLLDTTPLSSSYSPVQPLFAPCPIPAQHCIFDDYSPISPVVWDQAEQLPFLDTPLHHSYSPPSDLAFAPDAFSPPHHHQTYSPDPSYTRMFRGRKSKSAAEVLDELRPYACDICSAAFARSHDRDRHKRSHTGETPYRCHGCGTGFKRPDARKRHWERDPACAQEDWLRVRHTPEGAKRRARAKTKPIKKQIEM